MQNEDATDGNVEIASLSMRYRNNEIGLGSGLDFSVQVVCMVFAGNAIELCRRTTTPTPAVHHYLQIRSSRWRFSHSFHTGHTQLIAESSAGTPNTGANEDEFQ